jgi:transglutaminase/protease-like cytokinesis protein 3
MSAARGLVLSALGTVTVGCAPPPARDATSSSVSVAEHPHPAGIHAPAEAEVSIETLAKYIAEAEPDELGRAKDAHDWIATHVGYDAWSLTYGTRSEAADPHVVFASRRGVCAGYARLFTLLARALGLEAEYVTGLACQGKSCGLHAWSAVRAHGRWRVLDVTWDAGVVTEGRFVPRYSTKYLFFDPVAHADSHRPDALDWYLAPPSPREPSMERGLLF